MPEFKKNILCNMPECVFQNILVFSTAQELGIIASCCKILNVESERAAYLILKRMKLPHMCREVKDTFMLQADSVCYTNRYQLHLITRHRLMIIGGTGSNSKNSFILTPGTNEWVAAPTLRTPRQSSCAVSIQGQILVISGDSSASACSVEILSENVMRWSTLNSLPKDLRRPSVTSSRSEVFIIGGFSPNEGEYSSEIYCKAFSTANRKLSKWELVSSDMPNARCDHASVFYKGLLWIAGGRVQRNLASSNNGSQISNSIDIYNLEKKSWSTGSPMKRSRAEFKLLVVQNSLYAVGGDRGENNVPIQGTIEKYDDDSKTWQVITTFVSLRIQYAIASMGNRIYILGGRDLDKHIEFSNYDVFDIKSNQWNPTSGMGSGSKSKLLGRSGDRALPVRRFVQGEAVSFQSSLVMW